MPNRIVNKRIPYSRSTWEHSDVGFKKASQCAVPCGSAEARHDPLLKLSNVEMEELETQADSVRSATSSEDCCWGQDAIERMKFSDHERIKLNNNEGAARGQGILKLLNKPKASPSEEDKEEESIKQVRPQKWSARPKILQRGSKSQSQTVDAVQREATKHEQPAKAAAAPRILQRTSEPSDQPQMSKTELVAAYRDWQRERTAYRQQRMREGQSCSWVNGLGPKGSSHTAQSAKEEEAAPQKQLDDSSTAKPKLRSSATLFVPRGGASRDRGSPGSTENCEMPQDKDDRRIENTPCCTIAQDHKPAQSSPPYAMPSMSQKSGRAPIRCVIEGAFGNRLNSIGMVDKDVVTEVLVVVSENAYPTGTSWELDDLAQTRAMHVLLESLQVLAGKLKSYETSADNKQLTIGYSEVPSDTLCWNYAKIGFCPRESCRWVHAALEVFVIKIILQPLVPTVQCTVLSPVGVAPPQPPMQFFFVQAEALPMMPPAMPVTAVDAAMVASFQGQQVNSAVHEISSADSSTTAQVSAAGDSTTSINSDCPNRPSSPQERVGDSALEDEAKSASDEPAPGSGPASRICWADVEDDY